MPRAAHRVLDARRRAFVVFVSVHLCDDVKCYAMTRQLLHRCIPYLFADIIYTHAMHERRLILIPSSVVTRVRVP
jgi:hypothetical protein